MYTSEEALKLLLGDYSEPVKIKTDLEKAMDLLIGEDSIEKAKNISKLVKKQITNKEGQKQTVYVDPNKDKTTLESKKQEEIENKPKSIGSGTIPKGTTIIDDNGKKFHVNTDKKLDFTEKNGDKVTFEVNGVKYHVEKTNVKELNIEVEKKTKDKPKESVEKANTENDFEYKKYMDKSIGKTRDEMPQIDPNDIDSFLIHYSSKGVAIKKLDKVLSKLKPTQSDINDDKILKKIKNKSDWKDRKYIISLDGYLLDGHHDWATGLEFDPEYEVTCYRINLPIKKLITRTNKMSIAYKKDIEDNKLEKSLSFGALNSNAMNFSINEHITDCGFTYSNVKGDDSAIADFVDKTAELCEKYGVNKNIIRFTTEITDKKAWADTDVDKFNNKIITIKLFTQNEKGAVFSDHKNMNKLYEKSIQDDFHPAVPYNPVVCIATHEFTHILQLLAYPNKTDRDLARKKKYDKIEAGKISGYSKQNWFEYQAEVFLLYELGGEESNENIKSILRDIL